MIASASSTAATAPPVPVSGFGALPPASPASTTLTESPGPAAPSRAITCTRSPSRSRRPVAADPSSGSRSSTKRVGTAISICPVATGAVTRNV